MIETSSIQDQLDFAKSEIEILEKKVRKLEASNSLADQKISDLYRKLHNLSDWIKTHNTFHTEKNWEGPYLYD